MTSGETQPERTALAWQRTGLGVLAVAALLCHAALTRRAAVLLLVAGAVALLGLGVLGVLAPVRYRQVRTRVATGTAVAARGRIAAVSAVVVLTAAGAAVAVLTPR